MPDSIDPFMVFWGTTPWLVAIAGYWPCRALVSLFVRRASMRYGDPAWKDSFRAACSLPVRAEAPAFGLWFSLIMAWGIIVLAKPGADGVRAWLALPFGAAVLLWAGSGIAAWTHVVRLDTARIVFKQRALVVLGLAVVWVGGPIAASIGLAQLWR